MPSLQKEQKIGIAGGGLLGRLMAWQLSRCGYSVTVFDPNPMASSASAGFIAAAMLAPYSELLNAEPVVFEQGVQGLLVWQQWLADLEQDSGHLVPMQQQGSLVLAHAQDASELHRFQQRLFSHDCVSKERVSVLESRQAIMNLEPELAARFHRAVYLPQEGCLSNRDLYQALEQALLRYHVSWHAQVALTLKPGFIETAKKSYEFDWVLDCRGVGAKEQLKGLRGVRGELLWLHAPEVELQRPVRLMHPRYQLYIAPKPNQQYVIGATEIESESLAPVTVRSSLELLSALYSVHSGFAEAEVLESRVGLRPALTDNLPLITQELGFMAVNGLYRHGYLLSPSVINTALAQLGLLQQAPWPEIVNTASRLEALG